jgi:hypothetical protein
LPDVTCTSWEQIVGDLERALAQAPAEPVVPASRLAGYSGAPLPKKLGVKTGSIVTLIGAPKDFEKTIDGLPDGVSFRRRLSADPGLIIWFVKTQKELESRITDMAGHVGKDGLWIAWPKKASGIGSDLTQIVVRKVGLVNSLVDYKVCAIDQTWSALKFASR